MRPVPGASLYLEYASVRGTSVMVMARGGTSGGSMAGREMERSRVRRRLARSKRARDGLCALRRDATRPRRGRGRRSDTSLDSGGRRVEMQKRASQHVFDPSRKPRPRLSRAAPSERRARRARLGAFGAKPLAPSSRAPPAPPRPSFSSAWRRPPPPDPMAPVGTRRAPRTCDSTPVAWRTWRR